MPGVQFHYVSPQGGQPTLGVFEGSHLPALACGVQLITPDVHLPGSRVHSIHLGKAVSDAQAGLGKEGLLRLPDSGTGAGVGEGKQANLSGVWLGRR